MAAFIRLDCALYAAGAFLKKETDAVHNSFVKNDKQNENSEVVVPEIEHRKAFKADLVTPYFNDTSILLKPTTISFTSSIYSVSWR